MGSWVSFPPEMPIGEPRREQFVKMLSIRTKGKVASIQDAHAELCPGEGSRASQPEPICGAPPRRPGRPAGMFAGWDATSLTSPVSLPDVLPSVAALQRGKRHGGEEVLAPVAATLASMTARCPAVGLCALVVFAVPLVNARNACSERGLGGSWPAESFEGLPGLFPRPILVLFPAGRFVFLKNRTFSTRPKETALTRAARPCRPHAPLSSVVVVFSAALSPALRACALETSLHAFIGAGRAGVSLFVVASRL
ncbi:hypothetical protein MTO96_020442 [Rhipicephalus appendiculatus]